MASRENTNPGLQPLALTELRGSKLDGSSLDDDDRDDAKTRQCTDPCCLLIFLSYAGLVSYIIYFARVNGDIGKLMHGMDWQGNTCGIAPGRRHKQFLYWCAAEEYTVTDGICVSECPDSTETQHLCPGEAIRNQLCSTTSGEYKPCAEFETQNAYKVDIIVTRNVSAVDDYPTMPLLGMYCVPKKSKELLQQIIEKGHLSGYTGQFVVAMKGIYESRYFLVMLAIGTVISSFLFLFILGQFVEAVVYFVIAAVGVILLLLSIWFLSSAFRPQVNIFATYFPDHAKALAFTASGILFVIMLSFACTLIFAWQAIQSTCGAIRHACKMLSALPTLTLAPVLQLILKGSLFISFAYALAWVASLGNIVPTETPWDTTAGVSVSGVGRRIQLQPIHWVYLGIVAFAWVWAMEILTAMGQYAVSHAVVIYQLNRDESCRFLPLTVGYLNGLFFHLGTLAFGGFFMGVLWVLTAVCAFIAQQLHRSDGTANPAVKAACCCCMCLLKCMRDILEWTNEMAYVDTMIRGVGYIRACSNVFHMLAAHPETVAIVRGITKTVRLLGTVLIGGTGTYVAHLILTSKLTNNPLDSLQHSSPESSVLYSCSILGTTIASALICFGIAASFMISFDQIMDTLAYCIFWKKACGVPFDDIFNDGGVLAMEAPDMSDDDETPLVKDAAE